MVNGSKPGFVISTRQKADTLFGPLSKPLGAGESVVLPARRVAGYARINFLGISVLAFTILVEEANAGGFFTQTGIFTSALDVSTGLQAICDRIVPCGTYMRVTVTNTGPSPASISFLANGLPNASSGTGSGNGATGLQGPTGIQGVTGPGGGSQGTTGLQGATGVRGVTGIQGVTGVMGTTGTQGQTGLQGATGAGGGSDALEFLQSITLVADAADVTFAGLNGDVDVKYLISFTLQLRAGTGVNASLEFNGLSTGLSYVYWWSAGATGTGAGGLIFFGNPSEFLQGEIEVFAKTGRPRVAKSDFSNSRPFISEVSESWSDTADNVTSLTIHSDAALGFLAGATFSLYRMKNG